MNALKEDDSSDFSPEMRSVMFNKALDNAKVVSWKRAATVSKDCKVSHATASGWLLGSLPRDAKALLRVRDLYNICIDEWINGEKASSPSALNIQKLKNISKILRNYEKTQNVRLSDEQFGMLVVMLYEDEDKAEYLLNHASILN